MSPAGAFHEFEDQAEDMAAMATRQQCRDLGFEYEQTPGTYTAAEHPVAHDEGEADP